MTCVKIPDTRAREIRRPWRELFGFGHRAFEDLLHGLGRHLAADRRAGPAAVAAPECGYCGCVVDEKWDFCPRCGVHFVDCRYVAEFGDLDA